MDKERCVNKKLHPYWKTGIYGWLGEEVDDNDYVICPICEQILSMNYWDYSAEHNGDNKCPECGQELDYSEIYDFEDTLYFKQLLEMKDEKIEDLEAKLVENNKTIAKLSADETVYNEVIEDLEDKLAESEQLKDDAMYNLALLNQDLSDTKEKLSIERRAYNILQGNYSTLISAYDQLKQQLAEKDGELHQIYSHLGIEAFGEDIHEQALKALADKDELLRQKIGKMKLTDFIRMCKECGFMVQAKEIDNQTAIEELQKVKEFIREFVGINDVKFICSTTITDHIDQQIAQLKGDE